MEPSASAGRPAGAASDQLKRQAYATSQNTVAHLKAAVAITAETQQVGQATLEELAKQGETIERTQRKVDEVDANADKARSILWSMKSVFHTMGSKFKKKPKDPEAAAEEAAAVRAARRAKQAQAAGKPAPDPATLSAPKRGGGGSASAADASASRAVAAPGTIAGMQQEQDQLLEIISGNVDRIGQMGRQMGDELTRQDAMLDDLITGVGKVDIKLKDNAKEARRQAR